MTDEKYCGVCAGSGEGMYDGTRCHACGGTGIERDYDAEYEHQCERADHYNDMMEDR